MITIEQRTTGQGCPGMKGYDPEGKPWFKAVATDHRGDPATAERDCPWEAAAAVTEYLIGRLTTNTSKEAHHDRAN